jgi:hypothetical protein
MFLHPLQSSILAANGDVPDSEYYPVYFREGSVWVLVNMQQTSIVQITP